jgi:thioesterase domain-containing protein
VDRNALLAPKAGALAQRNKIIAPCDPVDTLLTQIWEDVLARRPIGMDENFFDLGGHSLLGARLLARVERAFGKKLTLVNFFEAPTIAQMVSLLESGGNSIAPSKVIPLQSSGSRPPIFLLGPQPLFRALTLRLPENQPIFAVSVLDTGTLPVPFQLQDIAAHYIKVIDEFRPTGPYTLMGWCNDGVIAYEMAQQLRGQPDRVPLVVMFESFNPANRHERASWPARKNRLKFHLSNITRLDTRRALEYCHERVRTIAENIRTQAWRALYNLHLRSDRRLNQGLTDSGQIRGLAVSEYRTQPYQGAVLLVRAQKRPSGAWADPASSWREFVPNLKVEDVPGNHKDMFVEPNVEVMAAALDAELLRLRRPPSPPSAE